MILLRRISFWAALAGLLAVGLLVRETTAREPVPTPPVTPAVKPDASDLAASGIVEALRENTRVGAPSAGLVESLHVAVWDRVEVGDPLFVLDRRELDARLATALAELEVREAELRKARRLAGRTDVLRELDAISVELAESRTDDVAVAQAYRDSARAAVAETRDALARRTVRAPRAGTVLQVNVREGEYVAPGGAEAPVVLGAIDVLQVRAEVDEQLAPLVRDGAGAVGYVKGDTSSPIHLEFVRIEPFVVPKENLTGSSVERVDTRVLRVVFRLPRNLARPVYVGQQLDLFLERGDVR